MHFIDDNNVSYVSVFDVVFSFNSSKYIAFHELKNVPHGIYLLTFLVDVRLTYVFFIICKHSSYILYWCCFSLSHPLSFSFIRLIYIYLFLFVAVKRIKGSWKLTKGIWFNQRGKSIFELWNNTGRRANTWIGKSPSNGTITQAINKLLINYSSLFIQLYLFAMLTRCWTKPKLLISTK